MIENHDQDIEKTSSPDGAARLSPRLTRWVAAFLALLSVVAIAVVILEVVVLKPRFDDVRAEQQERVDVVRVAQQFMVQFNTYQSDDMDAYKTSVNRLLSTKAKAAFKQAIDDSAQLVQASKLQSKGELLASGVASQDQDSATVLVVADATATSSVDTRARHFRWQVSLVKVHGNWLVDNFEAVS